MNYPQGTQELYDFLGAHSHEDAHNEHSLDVSADEPQKDEIHAPESVGHLDPILNKEPIFSHDEKTNTVTFKLSKLSPLKIIKDTWPYIVIFLVALFFYLVLFTNFSIISWFQTSTKDVAKVASASKPKYDNLDVYDKWIRSYFYEINDPKLIDPGNDISGNGLTNYQKFVLGLNPKKQDTMGLGMTDTEALMRGINPLTGSPLTDDQKNLISKYVDLEAVANKMALNAANNTPKVAGAYTENRDMVAIDTNIPGEVNIPKLKVTVPLIWTKDTKDFDKDLATGVVHYPGTAMPSEIGTAYISGHSSNYSWAKGSYNKIFDTLGNLKQYDSFTISATTVSGKKVTFHYVVTESKVYAADDQEQFQSRNKSVVALSTCWPIGTSSKRLVVFGDLTQTDK